ncbi:Wzz/FepE/Etk N-terminal domain-containing protein [Desulfarculus baarsii]
MAQATIDISKYLAILKRRWVLAVAVFLAVLAVGVFYCLFWPPIYQATCLVVVQPQKVPGDIIRTTVTSKIADRLQIITQQVLSRTRLTEIIDRFDLYPASKGKATPDDLAEQMRKDITIKITRENYFTITFVYNDPKLVAAVTNALAAFYVDSNLRIREEDAVGTARFLTREMERMRAQLREWESRITEFKLQHLHELPTARDENLGLLSQLNLKMGSLVDAIQKERTRLTYTEAQLGEEQWRLESLKMHRAELLRRGAAPSSEGDDENDPSALKARLDRLRVQYTEDHPDIQRALRQLARAEEAQKTRMQKILAEAKEKGISVEDATAQAADLQMASVRQSLERISGYIAEAKVNIAQFQEQQAEVQAQMAQVQTWIRNAPKVQEELTELTRGYEELNTAYQKMHAKWLDAKMSANLERTQRGEQFEVVDPAEAPDQPYQPDVKRVVPFSLGLAMALGLGLSFGLAYLDTSFTAVTQMEELTSLPVLVVIPPLETYDEIEAKRREMAILAAIYASLFMFLLALVAILAMGKGPALKKLILGLVS